MAEALKRRELIAYGAMAAPLAFGGLPLYIHAPDFFVVQHGLGLAALGVALGWLRLFDAGLDPFLGWLADKRPDLRAKMIALGAVLLPAGVLLMFAPPFGPPLIWFAIFMALASLGHSLVSVNLLGIGGLWRRSGREASAISAWREGFGLAGLIAAVILPSALAPVFGRQTALIAMGGALALGVALTLPRFLRWLRGVTLDSHHRNAALIPWRRLGPFYIVAALVTLSAALPAVLILMLVRDLLGAEPWAGLFLLLYFAAALPGAMVAGTMTRHIAPARLWAISLAVSVAVFGLALTLETGALIRFGLICIATGFTFGADLVLPPAILSVLLRRAGADQVAGRAYGAMTLLAKMSLALGGLIALPVLGAYGFNAGGANSPEAISALLYLYAGVPLALRLSAVVALVYFIRKGRL